MTNAQKSGSGCALVGAGCGIVSLLMIVVLGFIGYFGYRMVKGSYDGLKQLAELATIEEDVVNQSAFHPPSDGLMSLEQVEKLVYIQTQIRDAFGSDLSNLVQDQRSLMEELGQMSDFEKVKEVVSLSAKLVKPMGRAKRAQIEAINREGISLVEYRWLQYQAKAAFGIPDGQLDFGKIIESIGVDVDAEAPESKPTPTYVASPQNRSLLEPHAALLAETLILSAMGL
jgi:hypothetical protein